MVKEKSKFQEEMKELGLKNYFKRVSKLPLTEKIGELEKLKTSKKGLEKRIFKIDMKITSIKTMKDVADYIIMTDEYAMNLLQELQKKEHSSSKLMGSYKGVKNLVFFHYLQILKTAKFITMEKNPSNRLDRIIRVTEKGKGLSSVYRKIIIK